MTPELVYDHEKRRVVIGWGHTRSLASLLTKTVVIRSDTVAIAKDKNNVQSDPGTAVVMLKVKFCFTSGVFPPFLIVDLFHLFCSRFGLVRLFELVCLDLTFTCLTFL